MAFPEKSNRLIHEKSPYLLQHAHNPVDWYPWGQEAFEAAKRQDKPIFLSIGYATCHWCHVMEKESFENPQIAQLMNEAFINVKVDREEMPEVDSIYMEFAQALMSSAGGWPLNLVLTAELKPFFAMTYLPPENKRGLVGMVQFVQYIRQLWMSEERKQLIEQADKIVELFEKMSVSTGQEMPSEPTLQIAMELLYEFTDPVYGGLKGEPKFPMGYQSTFLLEFSAVHNDSRALFCCELSLDMMKRGGVYDHLAGGFSRYATDAQWIVPHFEKMLYDNALLARAYLDAWKYTKKESYRKVCEETLLYAMRDIAHQGGGFYSAEDADSDGHEGLYYTWTPSEIKEVLGDKDAELFCQFYGVAAEGNFEGRSILHIATPLEEFAQVRAMTVPEFTEILERAKKALLEKRLTRPHPFVDDKILSSWNGLMIDVLIRSALAFEVEEYAQVALKATEFLQRNLWKEGRLLRRWREEDARFFGGLDDYAFLIKGLISLFTYGAGSQWLQWAMQLCDVLEKEFKAPEGGFYYHLEDPHLLLRRCEYYDGAEPSGNAVHAENLLRLYQITFLPKYLKSAEDIFKASKIYMETYPPGACYHLIAFNRYLNLNAPTLVVALDEEESLKKEILSVLAFSYLPHVEIVWKREKDPILEQIPMLLDKKTIDGQTAVYICRQDRCEAPLIQNEEIMSLLRSLTSQRGRG